MSNALAVRDPGGSLQYYEQSALTEFGWHHEDLALVRESVAKGATDSEYRMMLYMAKTYKLDPLLKQIWLVKYGKGPAQIFVARDGYIAVGHRLGVLNGMQSGARIEWVPLKVEYDVWVGPENNRRKETRELTRDFQYVGWARVWKKGVDHPFETEVWEEEYSTGRDLWATKPRTQIGKVAESQALRKAISISGLYEPAEIGEVTEHETAAVAAAPVVTGEVVTSSAHNGSRDPRKAAKLKITRHLREVGIEDQDIVELVGALSGGQGGDEMPIADLDALAVRVQSEFKSLGDVSTYLHNHRARKRHAAAAAGDSTPATPEQVAALEKLEIDLAWDVDRVGWYLNKLGVGDWRDLTVAQAAECIAELESSLLVVDRRGAIAAASQRLASLKRV